MKKLGLVLAAAAMVAFAGSASAAPKGLKGDPEVGKKLWNFNVIMKPNAWDDNGNGCNGSRIFFTNNGGGGGQIGTLTWYLDPDANRDFEITDCDGTDGAASVEVDEDQGDVLVAIRVLGPNTSKLKFVCDVVNNPNVPAGEDLCVIDNVNLDKSKSFTKVMKNIAEGEFEEVLWTFDSTGTWKIFQVWVMEYNPL